MRTTFFCYTRGLIFLLCILFSVVASPQQYPFQNPDLSSEERARDLISRLTLEEKAVLMCDQSDAIPRLGIKKFNWWSEALHGYANNDNVTVFPEPIGMAASFNDELVYQIFDAVSDEARAKYHQWLQMGNENKRFLNLSVWTPNVNIFRDPCWGRGQETYGEDPYLTSRMGMQVVKGLQGPADAKYRKLLACAKHYAVYSGPEWSRHELNLNNVNPREFHETYLPAFKALVQVADVRQVMCAYQRLDDEPCCGSTRLLQRILRDEWDFKHIVVSDCGAITDFYTTHKVSSTPIHAASKGVLAGTDVECVWENYPYKTLPDAVTCDLIREEDIDKSLMRLLIGRFDLGDFEDYSMKGRTYRYTTDCLFPFGFGLSYTNFEIGNATISKTIIKDNETVQLTVPVKNTGKRDGTEIVQVYVRKVNDVEGPLKTLRGFRRVEVAAGKSQQVIIELPSSSFGFYDRVQRKIAVTPGEYEVYNGNSSDAKDLKKLNVVIQ